ncbi:MAG TPA: serine hydrolase domain-containing protein [Lysobacter sp.]
MDVRNGFVAVVLACALAPVARAEVPAATADRIDQLFKAYRQPGSPGCALAISDDRRTIHARGYGLANLEHGVAIDPGRSVFDVGSLAKQFTAASLLMLVEDKRLSLDDSVRKHLPELPAYLAPVTLRQLLNHTGGLPDYIALLWLNGINFEDVARADDVLRLVGRQRELFFAPGSRYTYNNTGYFLISQVVERVSGETLPAFAHKRIFKPLGMADTRYVDDYTLLVPHRASSYNPLGDRAYGLNFSNWVMTGDGALVSTADDLARWARNFHTPAVGGQALVDRLHARSTLADGTVLKYNNGINQETYRGVPIAVSFGGWAAFRSAIARFPEQDASIVLLCNVADAPVWNLVYDVADIYLEDALSPRPAASTTAAEPSLAGTYVNLDEGVTAQIAEREGALRYTGSGLNDSELTGQGGGRYLLGRNGDRAIRFTPAANATRALIESDGWNIDLFPAPTATPSADALEAYTGVYDSPETGARWTLFVQDGKLNYRDQRRPPFTLAPLTDDAFVHPFGGILHFRRDPAGRIQGFTLALEQMGRVRFMRDGGKSAAQPVQAASR